ELAARLPRLRRSDHPARAGALRGGQGGRDARRALRPVLPAHPGQRSPRRDGVRDRRHPAGRLRAHHGHEPARGDPTGSRPPRVLPAARVEAHRGDHRRPGGQHRAGLRDPVGPGHHHPRRRDTASEQHGRRGRGAVAGCGRAAPGRHHRRRRRRARGTKPRPLPALPASVRRAAAGGGLPGGRAGPRDHRARRSRADPGAGAGLRRAPRRDAARLLVRSRHEAGHAGQRRGSEPRPDVGGDQPHRHQDRPHLRSRGPQGAVERRRRLRDHPAGDQARRPHRDLRARPHLPVAGSDQPVPVPAARRRPHLLGGGREGLGPAHPRVGDGARRADRLRARDGAVLRRPQQRHHAIAGRGLPAAL
ncbi:MAG: Intramembrane protease RasP/YluC, implicated in cell division based on FtsL cleavage, partial [uncultured Solirubrobacteraceae bacterium]